MGFAIEQEQTQVKLAFRFQRHSELRGILLAECHAASQAEPDYSDAPLQLQLRTESKRLAAPEGAARISVGFHVRALTAEEKEQKPIFEVSCSYVLDYSLAPGYSPPDAELDAFKDGNAVFHCWPYAREWVQNVTMRMGLHIPPLPLLRLMPKRAEKKRRRTATAREQGPRSGEIAAPEAAPLHNLRRD